MVTIKDIARKAGVSVATVSYVLNDRPVSDEMKAKVLKAIDELNYVPNEIARRLRVKKNHTIALVLPDITNPFYPDLAKGCQDVAKENGFTLIMINTEDKEEQLSGAVNQVRQGGIDGLILANAMEKDMAEVESLLETPIPVVFAHRSIESLAVDSVTADNYSGGYEAARHLIANGHEKIAFIEGLLGSTVSINRKKGFEAAMNDAELPLRPDWIVEGKTDYDTSYNGVMQLLNSSSNDRPTAIFSSSDLMAVGAMDAVKDAGMFIPDDVAIIGYDDLFMTSSLQLTTVHVPRYEIGRQAMQMLIEKINDKDTNESFQNIVLDTSLIVRNTCGSQRVY
ncbi:LacI family DNA-binding transcriptional regulator [Salibacterium qingdaonense]|uniref:Transcriptional regulator, LacI family n=1 Tax=Salibacterium qingdaonense TaxID=266892 RepID=A0A1I4N9G4_9BACI|nr:LacI family DNA-binding transcriptional regulator [Salibacterium qingdaonense]SFM12118.1 transcriptional regulator, LacI family [Salibacterium qingdaonense]